MIDVVMLPSLLDASRVPGAQVVVLDVLRATSTIVAALANGARDIHVFENVTDVERAAPGLPRPVVKGGERQCVKIPGFDLGNSPREYVTEKIGGASICLTTTNGTRALLAVREAHQIYAASLLNAGATAAALLPDLAERDTILLCAGTEGKISVEDVLGAGAILFEILQKTYSPVLPLTDTAWIAYQTFVAAKPRLSAGLRLGQGALNLMEAGLEDDIEFCAQLDAAPLLAVVEKDPLRIVRR